MARRSQRPRRSSRPGDAVGVRLDAEMGDSPVDVSVNVDQAGGDNHPAGVDLGPRLHSSSMAGATALTTPSWIATSKWPLSRGRIDQVSTANCEVIELNTSLLPLYFYLTSGCLRI